MKIEYLIPKDIDIQTVGLNRIGLRVEFLANAESLQAGNPSAVQFVCTAEQARELAHALLKAASLQTEAPTEKH